MSTVLLMIHTKSTVLLISPSQKCHVLPICLGNISTVLPLSLSHQVNCPTYGIYSPCQLFYPLRLLTMSTFLPLSPVYHVKCSTPYTYSPGHLFYPLYVLTRSIVLPLSLLTRSTILPMPPTHLVNCSIHAILSTNVHWYIHATTYLRRKLRKLNNKPLVFNYLINLLRHLPNSCNPLSLCEYHICAAAICAKKAIKTWKR